MLTPGPPGSVVDHQTGRCVVPCLGQAAAMTTPAPETDCCNKFVQCNTCMQACDGDGGYGKVGINACCEKMSKCHWYADAPEGQKCMKYDTYRAGLSPVPSCAGKLTPLQFGKNDYPVGYDDDGTTDQTDDSAQWRKHPRTAPPTPSAISAVDGLDEIAIKLSPPFRRCHSSYTAHVPNDAKTFIVEPKLFPGVDPGDIYVNEKSCADWMLAKTDAWAEKCGGGVLCGCRGQMRLKDPSTGKYAYHAGPAECTYATFGVSASGTPSACQCSAFPTNCVADVYTDADYGGSAAQFTTGSYDTSEFTKKIANDAVSSIKVRGENCRAVLYGNGFSTAASSWKAPLTTGDYPTLTAPAASNQASAIAVTYVGLDHCTSGAWNDCAATGGPCQCSGQVRFGTSASDWLFREVSGEIECTGEAMGVGGGAYSNAKCQCCSVDPHTCSVPLSITSLPFEITVSTSPTPASRRRLDGTLTSAKQCDQASYAGAGGNGQAHSGAGCTCLMVKNLGVGYSPNALPPPSRRLRSDGWLNLGAGTFAKNCLQQLSCYHTFEIPAEYTITVDGANCVSMGKGLSPGWIFNAQPTSSSSRAAECAYMQENCELVQEMQVAGECPLPPSLKSAANADDAAVGPGAGSRAAAGDASSTDAEVAGGSVAAVCAALLVLAAWKRGRKQQQGEDTNIASSNLQYVEMVDDNSQL
eukprot:g3324.t1